MKKPAKKAVTPPKKKKPGATLRGRLLGLVGRWVWTATKGFLSVVFIVTAMAFLYGASMSDRVAARFDGRCWSVPSRVYSDGLVVYRGQWLSAWQLAERFDRLGYRRTSKAPAAEGEYQLLGPRLTVFLRAMKLPLLTRDAQIVRLEFGGERGQEVVSLIDTTTGTPVPILEIEPQELMQVFGDEHQSRQLVSVSEVPRSLVDAVLAAEDADFFNHIGIDLLGMMRALYINYRAGEVRQGGSTLTQQLAKAFFLTPERTVWRKMKELVIALVIESKYEKETILEIYLNEVYLGQRGSVSVHGFGEASQFYFGRPVERLTPAQSATLAGLIRSPSRYSPHRHPEAALRRRNQVLGAMRRAETIEEAAYQMAAESPLETVPFTRYERVAPYFFDYVAAQLAELYPDDGLSRLGMSLYTTIDVGVQAEAERALLEGLQKLEEEHPTLQRPDGEPRLQGAIVVLHPGTGHVLAMVGGRRYSKSQFNRITQARRQPGSAFKPFVYLTALEKFSLTKRFSNEQKTYEEVEGEPWTPKNYGRDYGGRVTLREALTRSLNVPTVELASQVGLDKIIQTAQSFGIDTPLEPHLSLSLGSFEVIPLELAVAYAGFANEGVLPYPLSLRTLVDEDGEVVKRDHFKIRTVTTPARAYMMTSVLKDVVNKGTARSLKWRGIDFPVAGKTGTTNDYRDAWFVGYTPDLVALVWVGFDDQRSLELPASKAALPIWADLMRNIGWRHSKQWFDPPRGVTEIDVCSETGLLATSGCPFPHVHEVFEADRVPTDECPVHRSRFRRFLESIGL